MEKFLLLFTFIGALTALALMASYIDKAKEVTTANGKTVNLQFNLTNPTVLVGLFIDACLPFIFATLTMESVGKAAQSVVCDPFKDTAGPAINILIKLLSMVSIVFAALVVKYGLL